MFDTWTNGYIEGYIVSTVIWVTILKLRTLFEFGQRIKLAIAEWLVGPLIDYPCSCEYFRNKGQGRRN